jgi:hypothetical protein
MLPRSSPSATQHTARQRSPLSYQDDEPHYTGTSLSRMTAAGRGSLELYAEEGMRAHSARMGWEEDSGSPPKRMVRALARQYQYAGVLDCLLVATGCNAPWSGGAEQFCS